MLAPHAFREALYHDCSEADVELAGALLTREPNAPVATSLSLADGGSALNDLQERRGPQARVAALPRGTTSERLLQFPEMHPLDDPESRGAPRIDCLRYWAPRACADALAVLLPFVRSGHLEQLTLRGPLFAPER